MFELDTYRLKKVISFTAWVKLFLWSGARCDFREISYAAATDSTIFVSI